MDGEHQAVRDARELVARALEMEVKDLNDDTAVPVTTARGVLMQISVRYDKILQANYPATVGSIIEDVRRAFSN